MAPIIDPIADVTICGSSYTLPPITGTNISPNAAYFTEMNGTGISYSPGDVISASATLFAFDRRGPVGCSDEEPFTVTINPVPVVDPVPDNEACMESVFQVYFTGTPGATFTWQNSNTAIGLAASGTGDINFNTPMLAAPEVATITVTPTQASCTGVPRAFQMTVNIWLDSFARASPKVFLQGAYNSALQIHVDSLRVKGLLPITEPYTALPNFTHVAGGGEQTTPAVLAVSGPNAIVDWVFLELRSAANPTQVLATRSALLQRDGDVVDVDGVSPVVFGIGANNGYSLAVRHRNHLGIQLGNSTSYPGCSAVKTDFRTMPAQGFFTYNGLNPAQKTIGGVFALWAGNGRTDYQLKYNGSLNDRNAILSVVGLSTPNTVVPGYYLEDYNLDGAVKYNGSANDRNVLLGNVGITTPSAILWDQVAQ